MANSLPTKEVIELKPFKKFIMTIGEIPTSYLESMTYSEMLIWFCDYLQNIVIPAVNNNADVVNEVKDLYIELKKYVDEYFDNLDIQTEVNNKLDDMAESGQLVDIISEYLNTKCILGFDTISDLQDAENLRNGTLVKTYGRNTYNDKFGAFYKVRTLTSSDTIDEYNIVSLINYPTLIAEKITNYLYDKTIYGFDNISSMSTSNVLKNGYFCKTYGRNQVNDKFGAFYKVRTKISSDNVDGYNIVQLSDNNLIAERIDDSERKITIVIGDSWTSDDQASITARNGADSWVNKYAEMTENQVINVADGGAGFARGGVNTGHNFAAQYDTALAQINRPDLVDTIIIYGGINDIDNDVNNDTIINRLNILATNIQNNTPNAKVYLAYYNHVNRNITNVNKLTISKVLEATQKYGWSTNASYGWLFGKNGECFATDNYHPNAKGCERILSCMMNFIHGGDGIEIPVTFSDMWFDNGQVQGQVNVTNIVNNVYYNPLNARVHGQLLILTSGGWVSVDNNVNPAWRIDSDLNITNLYDNTFAVGFDSTNMVFSLSGYTGRNNHNLRLWIHGYNRSGSNVFINGFGISLDYQI